MSGKGSLGTRTIEVTGAAIFGAASAVVAVISAPYLPRVPVWNIALIDPVSILWISCYLIFGVRSGLTASIIGTIALMPVDPMPPIGPLMKFAATSSMILVPALLLRLTSGRLGHSGSRLSLQFTRPRVYIAFMAVATLIRDVVMITFNLLLFMTVLAPNLPYVSTSVIGLGNTTGWAAIIIIAGLINTEQSIWDVSIPWIALRPTKVLEDYGIW
jgi:riboflavin transporter FmnP